MWDIYTKKIAYKKYMIISTKYKDKEWKITKKDIEKLKKISSQSLLLAIFQLSK